MKNFKTHSLFLFFFALPFAVISQQVRVDKNLYMVIDTTIQSPSANADSTFLMLKRWCINNTTNYNDMLKGEIFGSSIKLLRVQDYWAFAGTRQDYSQDLVLEIKKDKIYVRLENFKTYSNDKHIRPIDYADKEGYPADRFFIKNGKLKNYSKFYSDVRQQFVELTNLITQNLKL